MASSAFLASHNATICKAGALITKRCVVDQVHAGVQSSRCWSTLRHSAFKHGKCDKKGPLKKLPNPFSSDRFHDYESQAGGSGRQQLAASTSYPSDTPPSRGCSRVERLESRRKNVRTFATADTATGATEAQEVEHFTLTTPLYYANAAPHMGSAYPTFAADALARFQRLQGKKVTFITGTDEHGEKIATSAAAAGKEPKEFVDSVAEEFKALWHDLDISYDSFIRTTNDTHEKIVAETIQRVWEKGDIYRAEYKGLYCVACEEYKDEKDLIGTEADGSGEKIVCPTHRKPCQHRQEDNYFFKLSKYQSDIERLFETNPDFVRPTFRKNEVLEWVKDGVRDFSISRAAVEWGIRIPADPKQTVYVWFDALLGYVSALLKEGDEPTLENAVAKGWPASVHIIGKDILRFHAVYWPGMLLSAGLPLPRSVFGHGFLTKDGLKMGKSLGNVIEPTALVKQYGSDAVRYFFLKEVEFGKDGDFSEERFINIVNANLANAIGNLLNRTLGLLKKNCGGALTADAASLPEDHPLRLTTENAVRKAAEEYTNLQFGAAGEAALSIAVAGNEYIDTVAPWSQFKKGDAEKAQAALDLLAILEASRILAIALSPIAPRVTQRIYLQLGYSEDDWKAVTWADTTWGKLKAGQQMAEPKPVFVRLEAPGGGAEAPPPKPKSAKAQKKQKSEKKPAVVTS